MSLKDYWKHLHVLIFILKISSRHIQKYLNQNESNDGTNETLFTIYGFDIVFQQVCTICFNFGQVKLSEIKSNKRVVWICISSRNQQSI